MSDRDCEKYTLWYTSGDRQASMWGGDYESEAEAWEQQPAVEKEFRANCSSPELSDKGKDEIDWFITECDADWEVRNKLQKEAQDLLDEGKPAVVRIGDDELLLDGDSIWGGYDEDATWSVESPDKDDS